MLEKELHLLDDRLNNHFEEDGARFESIDKKQEKTIAMLVEQNRVMTEHIKKVEPYLQGFAGFGIVWKVLVAIGGAVLIWVQIKAVIWPK